MNGSVPAALLDEVLRANLAIPDAGLATLTWGRPEALATARAGAT